MEKIKPSEIVITKSFEQTKPSPTKMRTVISYIKEHGELDKPIVLNGNVLIDRYIRYLAAIECGLEEVPYITLQEYMMHNDKGVVFYICGKFKNCDKEYIWKIPDGIYVNAGDRVLVESECGEGKNSAVVTVTNVFTSNSKRMFSRHKRVIKKL